MVKPEATKRRHVARVSELLDDVHLGAELIRGIVKGLRLFPGPMDEGTRRIDVGHVVRTAARLVRFEVRPKATLKVSCPEPPPVVLGDEGKFDSSRSQPVAQTRHKRPRRRPCQRDRCARSHRRPKCEHRSSGQPPRDPEQIQDRIFEPRRNPLARVRASDYRWVTVSCNRWAEASGCTRNVAAGTTFRVTLPAFDASKSALAPRAEERR